MAPVAGGVPATRAVAKVTEQAIGLTPALHEAPDMPAPGAADTKVAPGHSWSRTVKVVPAARSTVPMFPMLNESVSCPPAYTIVGAALAMVSRGEDGA